LNHEETEHKLNTHGKVYDNSKDALVESVPGSSSYLRRPSPTATLIFGIRGDTWTSRVVIGSCSIDD